MIMDSPSNPLRVEAMPGQRADLLERFGISARAEPILEDRAGVSRARRAPAHGFGPDGHGKGGRS